MQPFRAGFDFQNESRMGCCAIFRTFIGKQPECFSVLYEICPAETAIGADTFVPLLFFRPGFTETDTKLPCKKIIIRY